MVYKEEDIRASDIRKQLGEPIQSGPRGSTSYFVQHIVIKTDEGLKELLKKSRVSFQRYDHGLLLRCHYSTQLHLIPVPYALLLRLTYTNGEISIRNRSPFRFLMWLGLPIPILKAIAPLMVTITQAGIQMDAEGISLTLEGPGSISTQQRFFNLVERDRIDHENKRKNPPPVYSSES